MNKRIGIAFSGGGGRGYFHIGVMKALEEADITPSVISGTSAGCIAGLCLAAGLKIQQFHGNLPSNPVYNLKNLSPGLEGFTELKTVKDFIREFIPQDRIEDLPIQFKPVCTNLYSSQPYAPEKGDIITWVTASCAVPVVVKPVEIDNTPYVDGGLSCNLPARFIRDKCDILIGVNLFPASFWDASRNTSWRTIVNRSIELALQHNAEFDLSLCDHVITDHRLGNYLPYKYNFKDELIEMGYNAAKKILPLSLDEEA